MNMNEPITFGSVCSGIEAASVAWHPLGWRAAWLSEIEPFPCQLLAHRYPDVPNLGNMLIIPQLLRNGDIFPPDVLCGGTPCQAFSLAGLRNSLDDARGNLSLTFCEIANEIDIQRAANGLLPCVAVWENVPGVLSTHDNAFGHFLAGLAGEDEALAPEPCPPAGKSGRYWRWDKKSGQHTLGWPKSGAVIGPQRAVAWRVLDAQYFGLAQRRRRVFVVASARDGFDPAAVLLEFDGVRRDIAPRRSTGQETAGTLAARTDGGGFPGTDEACSGYIQPVKTVDVCPTLRAGGNSTGGDRPPGTDVDTADSLVVMQAVAFSCKDYGADYSVELAPTMRAMGHSSSHANAGGQLAVCVTGDITHTLKAEGFDASEDGTGRGQPIVATTGALCAHTYSGGMGGRPDMATQGYFQPVGMAVRRLMPVECERMQGFPDGYTATPLAERRKAARGKVRVMADGPRYKALGNSWAVPVVRWLGRRIDARLRALDARAA